MTIAFLLFGLLHGINQGLDNIIERFHLDRPAEASPALSDLFFVNLEYFDAARAFGAGAIHLIIARVSDQRDSGAIAICINSLSMWQ